MGLSRGRVKSWGSVERGFKLWGSVERGLNSGAQ